MNIDREQVKRLAELTLPLDIKIAEIELTAEDILTLEPGSLVKVSLPESLEVILLIAGEAFARGRLLREEGQVYVEIEEVFD